MASKFTCGKTKTCKIVRNVLATYSIETVLKDLDNSHPFSISTDASNKGNIKTFPIVIRYFTKEKGVCTKLLSFYNSDSEMSIDIANSIKSKLEDRKLSLINVTSLSADNANVNFGSRKSVFVEFKKSNPNILGIGCLCHVLNNAFKNGLKLLKFDLEYIIIKTFNEFSSSTKNTASLKEMFEFCELEWSEMLRHVSTRWLTLTPAVERFLKNYPTIKAYFLSEDSCPPILSQFFQHELSEAYLGFVHNIGNTILSAIKRLEENNTLVIIEMFQIIKQLYDKFDQQKSEQFYGFLAESICCKSDNQQEVLLFKKRAEECLSYICTYVETRFTLKNNKFEKLCIFNLNPPISFHDFVEVIQLFSIKKIDLDQLFDEFISLKAFAENISKEKSVEEKWKEFLKSGSFPNFEEICKFVFSIPHSNAASERIFSLMFNFWRKERNKLLIENLESELIIKTNFEYTCTEFFNFLKTEHGLHGIVNQVQKNDKYFL